MSFKVSRPKNVQSQHLDAADHLYIPDQCSCSIHNVLHDDVEQSWLMFKLDPQVAVLPLHALGY